MPLERLAGKSIVGAIAGGWLAVEGAKRLRGIECRTGDLLAIPLAAAIAIGRIGCLLTGAGDRTFGVATTLPLAFDFGDGVAACRCRSSRRSSSSASLSSCAPGAGAPRRRATSSAASSPPISPSGSPSTSSNPRDCRWPGSLRDPVGHRPRSCRPPAGYAALVSHFLTTAVRRCLRWVGSAISAAIARGRRAASSPAAARRSPRRAASVSCSRSTSTAAPRALGEALVHGDRRRLRPLRPRRSGRRHLVHRRPGEERVEGQGGSPPPPRSSGAGRRSG